MDPLNIQKTELHVGAKIGFEFVSDVDAITDRFVDDFFAEFAAAKKAGRDKVVFILPVGPVGQYDIIAQKCNRENISLCDLVVINMDEYLVSETGGFISNDDPLSFHRHMEDHFYGLLDPALAPPENQRIFPDPHDIENVPAALRHDGGTDVCFGGIGITGHVAFNDPPEPGEHYSVEEFANLPSRVVRLSRESRLINSVTTSGGNVDRIPEYAVTVGMKEILESRKVRIYMNRPWQAAMVRKILHGPIVAQVPASLLQTHPDVYFVISDIVGELPQPQLR
ncbi:MAG: glucosamine-6-phosphate isomerase [Rhodospirillales bacterium]|jgi:glucosamine-6-phosphate deaminase|nr:glucosamine-6-phosphate isomerase [Rhodospirillales bacterium]